MKVLVQFDAYASDYEIKGEIGAVKAIDGVNSVTLMRRVSGGAPLFCLELDVADDKAPTATEKLESYKSQYAGQISNVSVLAYAAV